MNIAMIKHKNNDKIYWFEVPDQILDDVTPGAHVICDTARGKARGIVVGIASDDDDLMDVAIASGARFPLHKIISVIAVPTAIPVGSIKIPSYMSSTTPRDEKIARRFLEFYHTRKFNTRVLVNKDHVLSDGYTAYLVAKVIGLDCLDGLVSFQNR